MAQHFSPSILTNIARQTMFDYNLLPDYSPAALQELALINTPAPKPADARDMRKTLFFSIDNDDSEDLDQVTYAEKNGSGYKIFVAVADVDALVKKDSPINEHAQQNTTTVYTPTKNFAMIPEKLSTNLTSLAEKQDRMAMVVEVEVKEDGSLGPYSIYPALVHNWAKLAYPSVGDWLEGKGKIDKLTPELGAQLRLQDEAAQLLKRYRQKAGSLTLQTIEAKPVIDGETIVSIELQKPNRAKQLIEHFMISANTAVTLFLQSKNFPAFRRIVKKPKYWDKIVKVAEERGTTLPAEPDSKALEVFLSQEKERDELRFPDLSLTIVKLLGRGEYEVQLPGQNGSGHFALAIANYSHSTAPNRRFPDVITQRLIKAALSQTEIPYDNHELEILAQHCTEQETAADKVQRKMTKSAAAIFLQDKIGQIFDGIITGVNEKGVWVRVIDPPVEGKVVKNAGTSGVGDKVRAQLLSLDVMNGYIDFALVNGR